jgi:dihydrofolate reductase
VKVLGADVARQCLDLGELDEVLAIVVPVFLGDGTPFFRQAGGRRVEFETLVVESVADASYIWLRVGRSGGPA